MRIVGYWGDIDLGPDGPDDVELNHGASEAVTMDRQVGLDKIREIVSDQWFFAGAEDIGTRSEASIPNATTPLAHVYPKDRDQIRDIVKIANQYGIPIWPIGKGKNWGYGAGTAVRPDNLILCLERLDNIIEVNAELAYAVIEPGVTYRQLHEYLVEKGYELAVDPVDGTADGSILGNALDRGHGGTDYGDHYSTLCGLEVILPNGKIMQTGGGPENNQAWHTYKWGVGPIVEGMFSQGNFGIVVKAGIWLMPRHRNCVSVSLEIDTDEQFSEAVDAFRELELKGVIDSKLTVANDYLMISISSDYPHHLAPDGYLTDESMAILRKQYNTTRWIAAAAIYGDWWTIFAKKRQIRKALSGYGKLMFLGDRLSRFLARVAEESLAPNPSTNLFSLSGRLLVKMTGKPMRMLESAPHVHEHHKGVPSDYFIERAFFGDPPCLASFGKGDEINLGEHRKGKMWFAPVVPMVGHQALFVINGCKTLFHQHGFDFAAGLLLFNPRTVITITKITFDKEDPEHRQSAQALFDALHAWCIEHGYQVYRTNVTHMPTVTECAPTFKWFLNEIKQKVDPNNIIAPGKYGVG